MKNIKGKVIKIKSNIYTIRADGIEYEGTARGKFKIQDISPVVGDNVEFEKTENNQIVINNILEREMYLKRPKVSNISQIVFVISPKMPKPNLCILDKGLCFAEFLGVKQIIVINKKDLDEDKANEIANIYTKTGYRVIMTNANTKEGLEDLKNELKGNTSVLSRTIRCTVSLLLQIAY